MSHAAASIRFVFAIVAAGALVGAAVRFAHHYALYTEQLTRFVSF